MALMAPADANAAMNAVLVSATTYHAAAHTASPGTTGANETTSSTRGGFTVGAAADGKVSNAASITIGTAGTAAITHIGVWSAATTGSYKIGAALSSSVTAASITVAAGALTFTAS